MNILMVTERYIPIWGGAENQLRQLCPHLISAGCKVEIVTRRWHYDLAEKEFVDGVLVHRIGMPGASLSAKIVFIVMLLLFLFRASRKTDVYHSHGAVKMGVICWFVAAMCRKKNVAKIATAGHIPKLLNTITGRLLIYFFNRSSAIISMTAEIDEELLKAGTSLQKVVTITNGVDCNRFISGTSEQRLRLKKEYGVEQNSPVVVFSSRLVFRKGLDILIEAWPSILQNIPDAYLLVIGSGIGQQDSVEDEIKERVLAEKISHVIFVGETDTPEIFLSIADCFVFPSRKEGFPNALMEAMASKLACVASLVGGVEDLITDGVNGLLFEAENSASLAEKCLGVFSMKEQSLSIGENARQHMLAQFSFETISSRYVELYHRICN